MIAPNKHRQIHRQKLRILPPVHYAHQRTNPPVHQGKVPQWSEFLFLLVRYSGAESL